MALKRWAVRQISGLLSDYLEGITEQNLQASLSLEVGEVEIRHVRVHSELLGSLQLLSSDVSVSARIPWRNLGSEPTVITVQNVWVEVQAAKGDEQTAREELRRWRARKRRSVEAQVERARAQAEEEPRRGVAARFGHAALRQLQVRVEGLKARVHPEAASSMDLSITRLALDEGCGDDSVPAEVRRHVASLDKVLELVGLSCHLCRREADSEHWSALRRALEEKQRRLESSAGSDGLAAEVVEIKGALMQTKKACPLMGPLSLDARLWHSRAGGVLWLQTELQVAPSIAALCLSPSNMEYISNIWNWYTEHFSRPRLRHDEQVPTCSGPDYAELCVRRARGEEQEGDQQRLEEIEDLAPVEWLARWQKSVEAPEAQPRGRRWLRPWRQVPEEDDIEDIVEEAGKQSFFEEVEGPRRLELRVVIPTCRILSLEADAQSAHDLRLEGGVQGQLSLSTAREGAMRDFMKAAWDADVSAKLSSIAVLLGDEPLMLLRHSNNEQPPSPPKRQASQDDEDEFFDVESDVEDEEVWNATESAAVNLLIRCARFGGSTASGGAALPWDFRVRLKQEPFRFLLAPQTTHSALNLVLSVIRAATLTRVPAQKVLTDPHSPMAAQEEEFEAIALDLDLDVAAPVFRWDLSEGHVTVALGRLVFRSSQAPPPQQLSPPERCDWRKFACFCQLTETSITVGEKSVECRVYEPSTMSLRAWREADSWHWTLDSQAVRWVIDPLFMQVTGQLPVSFDYAISPLRDVLSDTVPISGDARSDEVPTADVTVEQVTESAKPKTHFKLAIASTEFVLCPAAGQKVSLSLDGISAQYCGYEGRHDVQGEVASCHLSCDSVVLVSFTRGASLEAKSAQDVHVKAGSTLIAVQWYERYIRLAMLAVDEASKALAAGHEVSQRLLPPVDAGIFAQLWGRYVIRPIQARVKERAARRLKELLPGVEEDATVEEENPQPRGRCSVEVNLFYEGLTVSFPGAAEKAPVLQLGVSGAECQIQGFQSGDAVVAVSLVAVNLELDGRRLLTPRRGDKLLRVRIFRRGKHSAIQWTASWAQICILFRQRDYDRLVAHVTAAVQDAMPSRKKAEVANVSVTDTGGQSEESVARSGAKFRLDIGAPLVFLPTDGRCLSTSRLPATGAHEGGQLEIDQGEPTFRPLEGEGCLVLDFGHVAARGGGSSEDVQLQLRGAQVLGVTSNSRQEVLWPVSMQAVLQMPKDGPVEFHAVSMEADGGGAVDHHMSLSRANLTLILDVLAENVCYAGRSGHVGTSLLPQPTTQNQKRRSGFCFSWRWPGELIFDVSFTETVPLGRLRLRGGMLGFSSMPTGTMYQLHSSSMTAIDVRTRSRNRVKTLLECAEGDAADGLGFRVDVNVPMDADTVAVIQLQKPAMHVLPQLVMDLVTAGLSSWQHCTFRNDRAALLAQLSISGPGKAEPEKPDKRGTRVQVNFLDGTFRIAEKWAEPTEHFEFAGSFLIHIFVNMEGIRIERFDLEGGALRLRSAKRSTTTLCPCLEWLVRGDQRRVDDFARMKRHTTYDLRSVIVPPYAIRMSARDHRAMVNAFLEFLSMDAESAEPDCETRSRDPLVLQLVENRLTLVAEVAIEGAEVQVMGEEGGSLVEVAAHCL
ncbi:unnamed protein product [Effrenium voratum]|nr:unnamed protein product [Effrenium voratum]